MKTQQGGKNETDRGGCAEILGVDVKPSEGIMLTRLEIESLRAAALQAHLRCQQIFKERGRPKCPTIQEEKG